LVEHQLPKLRVAGPNPVVRFEKPAMGELVTDINPIVEV
jgi:hypothetical protein